MYDEEQDPFGPLRPNAPVSVIKAAKASLKDPTRPHTPGDMGRVLFSTGDPNRPQSSYGMPSSKQFYDGGPKLGLQRAGSDARSRSILFADNLLNRGPTDFSRSPSLRVKQTPAETVATLKANYMESGTFYNDDRGSAGSMSLEQFHAEGSSSDDDDGPPRSILDPNRNDDLPPRPGTSRGRSSSGLEQPSDIGGEAPKPSCMGGAQVWEMGPQGPQSDDEDDLNDESYRHMYNYQPSDDLVHLGLKKPETASSTSLPPRPPLSPAAKVSISNDPCDPLVPWRLGTEQTLSALAVAVESCECSSEAEMNLIETTNRLASHVEYLRKQKDSSRWLKSPSTTFLDTRGQPVSMREAISENVFRLMDYSCTELLLKACGILLRVVKSRQPLLQTAKMLYRLSKDTSNDESFRKERLLEPLLRTIHVMVVSTINSSSGHSSSSMHEPLVFLNGCLKNISNDSVNQKALVKAGAMGVLANLLSQMCGPFASNPMCVLPSSSSSPFASSLPTTPTSGSAEASKGGLDRAGGFSPDTAGQVAVQVTGVMRNFAVSPNHTPFFISSGAMTALRLTAEALPNNAEVILNIGRILSKLSLHEECQAAMESDPAFAPLLLMLMERYQDNRAILLRVTFVLGNLTGGSNQYRLQISSVPGALASIITIMHRYALGTDARPDTAMHTSSTSRVDRLARAATRQDCLIKILRLTANLAISPQAGPLLAENDVITDSLVKLLSSYTYSDAEELVLNCVCALTNLSFYNSHTNKILSVEPEKLLQHVTPLLMCENEEAMVEAARTYGNFSRVARAREYMEKARVLEALILLLDHSSSELLYSVCGTLINFTADAARKGALVGLGCVKRLMEVMDQVATSSEFTFMEVGIISVALKALFNICADDGPASTENADVPSVSKDEASALLDCLLRVRGAAPAMVKSCAEGAEIVALCERLEVQLKRIG